MKNLFYFLFWPIQFLYELPKNYFLLVKADSFYAASLELFYKRQFLFFQDRNIYIKELESINTNSFLYQSFLSIYLCYFLLNRRLYCLLSLILLLSSIAYLHSSYLLLVLLTSSSVIYFLLSERGNYNILSVVISICSILVFNEFGVNLTVLISAFLTGILSISSGLLLSLFYCTTFFLTQEINSFIPVLAILIAVLLNSIFNIILLNNSNKSQNLFQTVKFVFTAVGIYKSETNNLKLMERKITLFSGLVATMPLSFVFPVFYASDQTILFTLLTVILFLNQSKILRIFDYHLIYSWIFLFSITLGVNYNLSILELFGLYLFGTNPIFNYAMDSYNFFKTRGFKLEPLVTISEDEAHTIKKELLNFIGDDQEELIIQPIDKIEEYNDLWNKESLFLEWLWWALIKKNVKFFPDWYSLFYSKNSQILLREITNEGSIGSVKNFIAFKPNSEVKNMLGAISISSFIPDRIMNKHLFHLKELKLIKVVKWSS